MAANCPKCGNIIDQDFGVAACNQCSAVLFIDMDGNAQLTEESATSEPVIQAFDLEPHLESFVPEEMSMVTESTQPLVILPEESPSEEPPAIEPISEEQLQTLAEIEPEGTGVFESTEQVLGGLSYSVKIENIDTKEIRMQIIEALDDIRFQWDPREVLKTMKAGTLELKNLNPVKASVIVQRMKDLSVKLSWEQHAYN